MQKHFCRALAFVLKHEGGYVPASANDPGGETNYGISKRAFPKYDIAGLTADQAGEIYHKFYWKPLLCDDIRDFAVAAKLFDVGVNIGLVTSISMAQSIIRDNGVFISVDGKMGPTTVGLINESEPKRFVAAICTRQREHYERLLVRNPGKYGKYKNGWLKRAAWFPHDKEIA